MRTLLAAAMRPGNFQVRPSLEVTFQHWPADETYWELFRGRALDHTQTRARRTFESWNLLDGDDPEPLVSVKLDAELNHIHVTRSIRSRAWEGRDAGGAIVSREVVRRVRELVGTIEASRGLEAVRDELRVLLHLAVVGTSRLPLTSLEAPLPEFSTGQLWFQYASDKARSLEFELRSTPVEDVPKLAEDWAGHDRVAEIPTFVRRMFNAVALSPWTDFVAKILDFLDRLVARNACNYGACNIEELGRVSGYVSRERGRSGCQDSK